MVRTAFSDQASITSGTTTPPRGWSQRRKVRWCAALRVKSHSASKVVRLSSTIARAPSAGHVNVHLLRDELEQVLRPAVKDPLERALTAAVFTATLEGTIERWRRARGRMKLQALLGRAFQALLRLGFAETPRRLKS